MRKLIVLLAAFALVPVAASAATISYATSGSTVYTTAMTGFATNGAGMAGMVVTVNDSVFGSWAALGGGSLYGVSLANGVSLTVGASSDTYSGDWTLTVPTGVTITSLALDGTLGQTTFDRDWSPYPGTEGSANGTNLTGFANYPGGVLVNYIHPLALNAGPAVGDEFVQMLLTFSSAAGALGNSGPGPTCSTRTLTTRSRPSRPTRSFPSPARCCCSEPASWVPPAPGGSVAPSLGVPRVHVCRRESRAGARLSFCTASCV